MTQKNRFWQDAERQISHLANIKIAAVRRRQIAKVTGAAPTGDSKSDER